MTRRTRRERSGLFPPFCSRFGPASHSSALLSAATCDISTISTDILRYSPFLCPDRASIYDTESGYHLTAVSANQRWYNGSLEDRTIYRSPRSWILLAMPDSPRDSGQISIPPNLRATETLGNRRSTYTRRRIRSLARELERRDPARALEVFHAYRICVCATCAHLEERERGRERNSKLPRVFPRETPRPGSICKFYARHARSIWRVTRVRVC